MLASNMAKVNLRSKLLILPLRHFSKCQQAQKKPKTKQCKHIPFPFLFMPTFYQAYGPTKPTMKTYAGAAGFDNFGLSCYTV